MPRFSAELQNTIGRVENKLHQFGFHRVGAHQWRCAVATGVICASLEEQGTPCLKCVWTDGKYTDTVFFECPAGYEGFREERAFLVWLNWYMSGNRFTERSTIGYANYLQAA